jgi:chemotaxis protein MotB
MGARRHILHPEEEESYFASMTDVFIGLLFIFIIMLMFFSIRFQEATASQEKSAIQLKEATAAQEKSAIQLKEATATQEEVTKQLQEATESREKAARRQNELINDLTGPETARTAILNQMAGFLKQKGISVTVIQNEGILRLPEEILFSSSKWELNSKVLEAVRALAEALDQVLPCYTVGTRSRAEHCLTTKAKIGAIFIEGHADADPYRPPNLIEQRRPPSGVPQPSTWSPFRSEPTATPNVQVEPHRVNVASQFPPKDNLDLSTLRATGTFRELLRAKQELSQYMSPAQKPILSVSGYGGHRQVDTIPGETPDQYKKRNRRIDLRVLMATPRSEDARNMERDVNNSELHP